MYGIPNMKLDKSVVDRRVRPYAGARASSFACGVDAADPAVAEGADSEYDAVVRRCGARHGRATSSAPGFARLRRGVVYAVDYLTSCHEVRCSTAGAPAIDAAGKDVVVIGGGDTGNDCVGTAMRQGCAQRARSSKCMP